MTNEKTVDLSDYDDIFANTAAAEPGDFDSIPDGNYQVLVDGVELKYTQSTNRPMLSWALKIFSGKYIGRYLWKNSVINDETEEKKANSVKYIKTDLETCGLHLDKFSDLGKRLGGLLDVPLEIRKKTVKKNGEEYENIFFNKKIELNLTPAGDPGDDIPF